MTTNSTTTTNTNDDQQQQQGRYLYHYPGITKDHSEMLFHNQKFVDDNGGKSAGELVARSILKPTIWWKIYLWTIFWKYAVTTRNMGGYCNKN